MRRKVAVGKPFDLKVSVSKDAKSAKTGEGTKNASRRIGVGEQWDIVVRERGGGVDLIDAITRSAVTVAALLASMVALALGAWLSIDQHDHGPLMAVWAVVGPIYAGAAGYYYSSKRRRD